MLERFRPKQAEVPEAPTFDLVWEDQVLESKDGSPIRLRGWSLLSPWTDWFLPYDAPELAELGMRCLHVAGVSYRPDVLQLREFSAGEVVTLRPEPTNPHDPNAVGVWDEAGVHQVGWVPRECAADIAAEMRGRDLFALVLKETLTPDDEPRRLALTILVVPTGAAEFHLKTEAELVADDSPIATAIRGPR
jgi:HIRAN domain-containing protein